MFFQVNGDNLTMVIHVPLGGNPRAVLVDAGVVGHTMLNCHAEQMKHSRELSSVLSRTILGSTLVSVSLSALGILTFSMFFTLFVSSIKVSVSFTYHFISSSPNETSLFFTTSIELLIIFSPL